LDATDNEKQPYAKKTNNEGPIYMDPLVYVLKKCRT